MNRFLSFALVVGLLSCLGMECPQGGTIGIPSGGGELEGTVSQVTGERIIAPSASSTSSGSVDGMATFALSDELDGEKSFSMFLNGNAACFSNAMRLKPGINKAGEFMVLARNAADCEEIDQYFVRVFEDATRINGDQQPVRTALLEGPKFSAFGDVQMTVDPDLDLIYVVSPPPSGETFVWKIFVYEGVSLASFDGSVSPARTIVMPSGERPKLTQITSDDALLYNYSGFNRIPNISQRDGELASAEIEEFSFSDIAAFDIDSEGRVWLLTVKSTTLGQPLTALVRRLTADFSDEDLTVLVTYDGFPGNIHVDSKGAVYIYAGGDLRIYDTIESGTADTMLEPTRVVSSVYFASSAFILVD
ncbi:MAG TPA: hypothetical protein P5081_07200 [Phycisphaerae bacterium]|nr:hypothetical protein [Phycisphaerae bacterium]HRW52656.1 hypothetical protein [Phycisphaerae bacterium]